jgi:hypothetical protein
MKIEDLAFSDKRKEDKDFVNDLIYENIALMDSNIKLLVENKSLKDRVESLRITLRRTREKSLEKVDREYMEFLMRKILGDEA